MQVGAELSWATVTAVTSHRPGTDLQHIWRPSLETFNASVAALGSHGMGNGLTLILQKQIVNLCQVSHYYPLPIPSLTCLTNLAIQVEESKSRQVQKRESKRDRMKPLFIL